MEELKHGYPKATIILTGRKALHSVTKEEHRRIRRLSTAPLSGHEALSSYVEYVEEIGMKILEDLSSMKEPVELLTETRKMAFKVITHVFMGEYSGTVVATVKTLYTDLIGGMTYSQPINLPGFPFHKALKVKFSSMYLLHNNKFSPIYICFPTRSLTIDVNNKNFIVKTPYLTKINYLTSVNSLIYIFSFFK